MRLFAFKMVPIGLCVAVASGLSCPAAPGGATFPKRTPWSQHTVNTDANVRPTVVATADFDGDGNLDVVAGYPGFESSTPAVVIFFQVDGDNFTAVPIAGSTDLAGLAALAVADMDGDGRSDVVAACNGRLVYLHSPADPRQAAGWAMSTIDESTGDDIGQWNDVAVGDIDRQRGPDIVACNANVGRLSWFQSPSDASSGAGWTRVDIDTRTRTNAASVVLVNIDGGAGWLDIVSTAPGEATARIAWYQNPTDPVAEAWTKTQIGNLPAATRIALGDLNADGRDDVVVTNPTGRLIGWYIRPADATTGWTGYQLTQYTSNVPTDVKVADLDGNNQLDVVVATQSGGSLRWFTPIGVQTLQWGENNLRDLSEDVGRIALGDFDKDGRLDVVAPLVGSTTNNDAIAWFENPEP